MKYYYQITKLTIGGATEIRYEVVKIDGRKKVYKVAAIVMNEIEWYECYKDISNKYDLVYFIKMNYKECTLKDIKDFIFQKKKII